MIDWGKGVIQFYIFKGREFLIKRDDLLSPTINGNKAYKFFFLLNANLNHMVSYGGNQSNAMLCLSYIAKEKNAKFTYFTPPLSNYLKNNIHGNLKLAKINGAIIKESKESLETKAKTFAKENNAIFINQGGNVEEKKGIEKLARQILNLGKNNLCVFCASGSGISAFLLQKELDSIDVITTPCVGGREFLIKQFEKFSSLIESRTSFESKFRPLFESKFKTPTIILPKKKYFFAKPNIDLLNIYKEWLNKGIEFDLIYDCVMWKAIEDNLQNLEYENYLFLHSGGLSANESILERYKFLNLL